MEEGVTLREYFESKFSELEKRIEVSRQGIEKRLDGMNEFRDALRDQSDKSPTRAEVESKLETFDKEIKLLNTFKDTLSGKASQTSVITANIFAVVGIILAIVLHFWK